MTRTPDRLSLGKGSSFVKSRLSRLPRTEESGRPTSGRSRSGAGMHDGSFSQPPVYSGNELVGLLTSETVARWLGDRLTDGHGILEEERSRR